jgi:lipoprotein-releasing system permease protein
MYKYLLCLKYLFRRGIAAASILSVTLGVATLVVVNSVMSGFATEMRQRIRGILADVIVEGGGIDGFSNAERHISAIQQAVGDRVAAVTALMETFGLLTIDALGQTQTFWVKVIGVDPVGKAQVGDFAEHLLLPMPPDQTFHVPPELRTWERLYLEREGLLQTRPTGASAGLQAPLPFGPSDSESAVQPATAMEPTSGRASSVGEPEPAAYLEPYPFQTPQAEGPPSREPANIPTSNGSLIEFDESALDQTMGVVMPYLVAAYRDPVLREDRVVVPLGYPVRLVVPGSGQRPLPRFARFVVVNYFKSGMSEYDQTNCYVDLKDLQRIRGLDGRATAMHLRLKDYRQAPEVVRKLRELFPPPFYRVATWEELQGPLLAAVETERRILTILLFLIIAVAGFGILAIFSMIVVEKTRDIAILKALGASDRGVEAIFLGYGLSLGLLGAAVGTLLGLEIVWHIDQIEQWMSRWTGREIFDRNLYYFDRIPTVVDPWTVALVAAGAMLIALLASVWPARRAARLRTIEALRHD